MNKYLANFILFHQYTGLTLFFIGFYKIISLTLNIKLTITRQNKTTVPSPQIIWEALPWQLSKVFTIKRPNLSPVFSVFSLYSLSFLPECSHTGFSFFLELELPKLILATWVLCAGLDAYVHACVSVSVRSTLPWVTHDWPALYHWWSFNWEIPCFPPAFTLQLIFFYIDEIYYYFFIALIKLWMIALIYSFSSLFSHSPIQKRSSWQEVSGIFCLLV